MRHSTRRIAAAAAMTLLLLAGLAAADMRQVPMVVIHSEAQIAAKPLKVWAYMASGKNFAAWFQGWRAQRNLKVNITRAGDVMDYADPWGNGGRSVVTYAVQGRELRVAHDPLKGGYVSQGRFLLTAASGGTHVDFWNQYSDTSAAAALDSMAQKIQADADSIMARLKFGVENPAPPLPPGGAPAAAKPAPVPATKH